MANGSGIIRRMPVASADLLDLTMQDAEGAATTLRQQLGPRATVVVFLRHFG
jgi:hypothetical protein